MMKVFMLTKGGSRPSGFDADGWKTAEFYLLCFWNSKNQKDVLRRVGVDITLAVICRLQANSIR